ncbi:MAG: phenylalanine--tRNA ligase subunit beta [Candidatus Omnitrophica bacterium]|nr:phenylalanine--tRNA ligase subunit beta [Candidatus Omnitrophota bacterium]
MRLSYNWLKEYVDVHAGPRDLATGLTMSGSEVGQMEERDGDAVMELEITTNRPDCLNIVGLAREASAVFNRDLNVPRAEISETSQERMDMECRIKAPGKCPRYTARIITGITVKPCGDKIRRHITSVGLREVNNIVDVTNFCLMEQGQPLHAFDLDKLEGGRVIVREAAKGEKITTIDGEERELEKGMLVIADAKKPVAIAGVMGGKETEVTESTKNILVESAYFDPVSVRRTAHALGLSTDSSYRFERGVDKGMIKPASDRAAELIVEEAGGDIGAFFDEGALEVETPTIKFDMARAGRILGIPLETDQVENIFRRLGITVNEKDENILTVTGPSFREDITREVDLIEEVARIYGYHNIPARVTKLVPQVTRKQHQRKVLEKLRTILAARGLNEIMTYSLVSREAVERFRAISADEVGLFNPVSEQHRFLTPHLADGMLRSVAWNVNRGNRDLGLFELGKRYSREGKGKYSESLTLCVGLTGDLRKNWEEGDRKAHFFDIKGMIDTVFTGFRLEPAYERAEIESFESATEVKITGEKAGFIAECGRSVLDKYDIEQPVFIAQIRLDGLIKNTDLAHHYRSIPRFPSSTRDVSVLCEGSLPARQIYDAILESGEELIRSAELVDVYTGEQVEAGKKSLTYSIEYGLDTRTLKDEEIDSVHSRVKDHIRKKLGVAFR